MKTLAEKVGYTPGPWEVRGSTECDTAVSIYNRSEVGWIGEVYSYHHESRSQEQGNNARLISQAPAMLEALVKVARYCENSRSLILHNSGIYFTAIQTIEAATGMTWEELNEE